MRIVRALAAAGPLTLLALAVGGGSCRQGSTQQSLKPQTPDYLTAVRAFYIGTAALQVGNLADASKNLDTAAKLMPDEPAVIVNQAILAIRNNQLDVAAQDVDKASKLAPNNAKIAYLQGVLKSRAGNFSGAAEDFRRAADLDPQDLRARYGVIQQTEREGGPDADAKMLSLLVEMVNAHPDNVVLVLEAARAASKVGDGKTLGDMVGRLGAMSEAWPSDAKSTYQHLKTTASGPDPRAAMSTVRLLSNYLMATPARRAAFNALNYPQPVPGETGDPLLRMLKVPNPPATPAPPDSKLTFTSRPIPGAGRADLIQAVYLTQDARPTLVTADAKNVRLAGESAALAFPGGATPQAPSPHSICAVDWNSDFQTDLVLAGAGGLRFYKQGTGGAFTDVTAKTKLPDSIASASAYGAWAADTDLDGDLDIVVSMSAGPLLVLQNNADGTFTPIRPFKDVTNVRDFQWADIDSDGAADAIVLDANGTLTVFRNERGGRFSQRSLPSGVAPVAAFTVMDANDDGNLDIVALKTDGSLVRISDSSGTDWQVSPIAKWPGTAPELKPGAAHLFAADLDNNGGVDIVASSGSTTVVWLHGKGPAYEALPAIEAGAWSAADTTGNGRLDLVALTSDGKPVILSNTGSAAYKWAEIRPYAAYRDRQKDPNKVEPDERVNSFGIDGSMEIRSGLLAQRQLISSPVVHFGLGENAGVDVARIVWPNGVMQAEFGLAPDASVAKIQRLSSSCPWIFAWNGKSMGFVTDFLWRSPLGLKINAQDTGAVAMTQDWVKIRGDQLQPRDGYYDIRITAELWETHFFDQVSLMTVDHPAGSEVFVDERFATPPPKFGPYVTGPLNPFARAIDDSGTDVSATVRDLDGKYLDTFGLGQYQGVARDHYVELTLPDSAPHAGPLWLVAQGWVHPTDSSLNLAMSQGTHPAPHGLSLVVADGRGGWVVARPNLGFPSGKTKTILTDLNGLFRPGAPRRLRLRTNLEVYWDRLAWAQGAPSAQIRTTRALPQSAELRYRGYSSYHDGPGSSPEIPIYDELEGTGQKWCDLIGFCTRYGDVKELLQKVDDRYVIMNAGDELALRFPAQPPPPAGWVRDYILIGDGWEKDGNLNTSFSKTVLPLPSHDNPMYNRAPGRLEDDPVYRRHPSDWQVYHTRYVEPDAFWTALRPKEDQ